MMKPEMNVDMVVSITTAIFEKSILRRRNTLNKRIVL